MVAGYDRGRILRVLAISATIFAAFLLLRPYGLGWYVIPAGFGVAILIILLALFRQHRMNRRLREVQHELEEMQKNKETES
jgi:Flp pilus assembly protein TadB